MRLDGRPVHFRSARDALAAGIGMVHQELSIVPDLTRRRERVSRRAARQRRRRRRWRAMAREAREHLDGLGIDVDPAAGSAGCRSACSSWSSSAACCSRGARIIILDEPTSALSPPEIERLFAVLRRLRRAARSFIFISHFLEDVLAISDTVTVFRNGRQGRDRAVRPRSTSLADRAHDRPGPRGAGGGYHGRVAARTTARTRRSCSRPRG